MLGGLRRGHARTLVGAVADRAMVTYVPEVTRPDRCTNQDRCRRIEMVRRLSSASQSLLEIGRVAILEELEPACVAAKAHPHSSLSALPRQALDLIEGNLADDASRERGRLGEAAASSSVRACDGRHEHSLVRDDGVCLVSVPHLPRSRRQVKHGSREAESLIWGELSQDPSTILRWTADAADGDVLLVQVADITATSRAEESVSRRSSRTRSPPTPVYAY